MSTSTARRQNGVAKVKKNIPRHVGFIPDGNRRWAMDHGLSKEAGYDHGINPGLQLYAGRANFYH